MFSPTYQEELTWRQVTHWLDSFGDVILHDQYYMETVSFWTESRSDSTECCTWCVTKKWFLSALWWASLWVWSLLFIQFYWRSVQNTLTGTQVQHFSSDWSGKIPAQMCWRAYELPWLPDNLTYTDIQITSFTHHNQHISLLVVQLLEAIYYHKKLWLLMDFDFRKESNDENRAVSCWSLL